MTDPIRRPLVLVAALAVPSRVIGAAGRIPWREPEDMRHFKATTMGHAVIMGRTTWTSIGRPLPGRRCIVVSRDPAFAAAGAEVFADLDMAIAAARSTDPEPHVIGGGAVYAATLPLATKLILTEIAMDVDGDVRFPAVDPAAWTETGRRTDGRLVFRVLERTTDA